MSARIRWINRGKNQRFMGRIIKPNEVFLAHEDEIPVAFRSFIMPVDPIPDPPNPMPSVEVAVPESTPVLVETEAAVVEQTEPAFVPKRHIPPGYHLKERSPGWFDVIDPTGKVVNEQPQTEEEAKELLKTLR